MINDDRSLPIVTLWGTYGSGTRRIAELLSEELGVPLHAGAFSSDDLERAADPAAKPEPDGNAWYLVQAIRETGRKYPTLNRLPTLERHAHEARSELIEAVQNDAKRGGVFMGRNGTMILADYPNALHVKLDGPCRERVQRGMEEDGISLAHARNRCRFEDDVRSQMSVSLFDWDPRDIDGYDLVLNTVQLSDAEVVEVITAASRMKLARPAG